MKVKTGITTPGWSQHRHEPYIPDAQSDTPARKAKRRKVKLGRLADRLGSFGRYASVSVLTACVLYPNARISLWVVGANMLLIGIAIGCSLRWRAS